MLLVEIIWIIGVKNQWTQISLHNFSLWVGTDITGLWMVVLILLYSVKPHSVAHRVQMVNLCKSGLHYPEQSQIKVT